LTLSDKIAMINHGKIEQCGTPEDIYRCPETIFVANIVGVTNRLSIDGQKFFVRPEDVEISKQRFLDHSEYRSLSEVKVRSDA
jgi:ABC-type Fe3+/spermidine/putrescine transport system ATPase subunit